MWTDSEDHIFEDKNTADECGAPVGIRTSNLLIRSQMLYPVELRAQNVLLPMNRYEWGVVLYLKTSVAKSVA